MTTIGAEAPAAASRMSKAGLNMLSKCLVIDLAGQGIANVLL